jgi:hypothetical protein
VLDLTSTAVAHYIDVVYTVPAGGALDYTSIYGLTLTLTGVGTSAISLSNPVGVESVTSTTTGAPVTTLITDHTQAQTDNVTRFRYFFAGAWVPGDVQVAIPAWQTAGGDQASATSVALHVVGPTVTLVNPTGSTGPVVTTGMDVNTLNGRTYFDLTLTAPVGYTINWAAVTSTTPIFSLTGAGVGTATLDSSQAPSILSKAGDNTSGTVRYWVNGTFATGAVTVVFTNGAPPVSVDLGAYTGSTFTPVIDAGAETIDIAFPVDSGYTLDHTSFNGGQVLLVGDALSTLAIDPSFAPVFLADNVVRYHLLGTLGTGSAQVAFIRGSWRVVPTAGGASIDDPGTATTTCMGSSLTTCTLASVTSGVIPSYIGEGQALNVDFPVPSGATIDPASLADFSQIAFACGTGCTATIDQGYAPTVTAGHTVQYRLTGTLVNGQHVTVTFVPGTWTYTNATPPVVTGTATLPATHTTYVDVSIAPSLGNNLGTGPLTIANTVISLGGAGGAALHADTSTTNTNALWLGGNTYRFFLTGSYTTGEVDVTFAAATVTDQTAAHTTGYANAQQILKFNALGPTATLVDPLSNQNVSSVALNGEGYIDVPFTLASGTLDPATIADPTGVFTISGAGATGWQIDTTKAPLLISQTGSTWVYRYWTVGAYTTGSVQITFASGSPFAGPVAPVNFTVGGVATPNLHHLDVQLTPTSGDTIDSSTVVDTQHEFEISGAGATGVQLVDAATPTLITGNTWRYYVSGAFTAGKVDLAFGADTFRTNGAAVGNAAKSDGFTILQLTGGVSNPQPGSVGGVDDLNNRSFVDVVFTLPTGATSLDVSSVTATAVTRARPRSSSGRTRMPAPTRSASSRPAPTAPARSTSPTSTAASRS